MFSFTLVGYWRTLSHLDKKWELNILYGGEANNLVSRVASAPAAEQAKAANTLVELLAFLSLAEFKQDAVKMGEHALTLLRRVSDLPGEAHALDSIGGVLYRQGKPQLALENFQKALAIQTKLFGTKHKDVADSFNNIAMAFKASGKYGEAYEYYQKAHAAFVELYGDKHSKVAQVLSNLGSLFFSQNKLTEAQDYYGKAFTILTAELGDKHPDIAVVLNNIGTVLQLSGKTDEAREKFTRALSIRQEVFGPQHPSVAACLLNLAKLENQQKNFKEAVKYAEDALAIQLGAVGDHTATLILLASIFEQAGQIDAAITQYEKVIKAQNKVLEENDPRIASTYLALGALKQKKSNLDDAAYNYTNALNILTTINGEKHQTVAAILNKLGGIFYELGKLEEATAFWRRALDSLIALNGGDNNLQSASVLHNLAVTLGSRNRKAEAIQYAQRAVMIRTSLLGAQHADTVQAKTTLDQISK